MDDQNGKYHIGLLSINTSNTFSHNCPTSKSLNCSLIFNSTLNMYANWSQTYRNDNEPASQCWYSPNQHNNFNFLYVVYPCFQVSTLYLVTTDHSEQMAVFVFINMCEFDKKLSPLQEIWWHLHIQGFCQVRRTLLWDEEERRNPCRS